MGLTALSNKNFTNKIYQKSFVSGVNGKNPLNPYECFSQIPCLIIRETFEHKKWAEDIYPLFFREFYKVC